MRSRSSTSSSKMSKRSHLGDFKNRARRTIFCCALLLLISAVPGSWLIDHCPVRIRFPEVAATVSSWEKANPRPDILLLGSSRLGSFVRTADLSAAIRAPVGDDSPLFFNSTIPGGNPITLQFLTHQLLATKRAPPRLVVLETKCRSSRTGQSLFYRRCYQNNDHG